MSFAEHLKEELKYAGIQYKELSANTGIAERALYTYVASNNPSMPPADVAVKIAKALDVSVEYLVDGSKSTEKLPVVYKKLIEDFDTLSESDKKSVLALVKEMKSHSL